ncbi:MAG: alpha/beta hydrolase [Gemmatimonadota bacterium]
MRSISSLAFASATILVAYSSSASAQTANANPWGGKTGPGKYANVNGLKLYYETHGSGRPLILLHGGLGAGSMFGTNIAALAKNHQVILVDLQGHGRTADIDRPIDPALMADDIAALIKHLRLQRPDVMGYSLGGGVAIHTAIKYPELIGRLVAVSALIRRNAFYPEILQQQAQVTSAAAPMMKETPMYQLYNAIAPRPADFPKLLDKLGDLMKKDFDLSQQFAGIKATTLIVAADGDIFPPAHAVEMFGLLGGGKRDAGWDGALRAQNAQLAIVPGTTHYNLFADPALAAVVIPFLNANAANVNPSR